MPYTLCYYDITYIRRYAILTPYAMLRYVVIVKIRCYYYIFSLLATLLADGYAVMILRLRHYNMAFHYIIIREY